MHTLTLYDEETAYTMRLLQFFVRDDASLFEVHAFTKRGALETYLKENTPDLLLVSEKDYRKEFAASAACPVMLLADGSCNPEAASMPAVPKYSAAPRIAEECCLFLFSRPETEKKALPKACLYAFAGPSGRCGKTLSALCAALLLSKTVPAVLLDFDPFSYLPKVLAASPVKTLSDLMYRMISHEEGLEEMLAQAALPVRSFRYLPPPAIPSDLTEAAGTEWDAFFRAFRTVFPVSAGIADLGILSVLYPEDLLFFDRVFVPMPKDPVSAEKCLRYLDRLPESVRNKTRSFPLPPPEDLSLDRLLNLLPHTPAFTAVQELFSGEAS